MAFYDQLFDQAERAVSGNLVVLERVKVSRLPIRFATMEIGKNDMFGSRGWYTEQSGRFVLRPDMKATLDTFYTVANRNDVRYLNESALTVESYYNATLRFIDVQVDDNLAFRKKVSSSPLPSPKYSHGDLSVLTNGVQGADSYKVHWLGWEGEDFEVMLDLGKPCNFRKINVGTLWDPKSWILHPEKVACQASSNGTDWESVGSQAVDGSQEKEEVTRNFTFTGDFRDIQFIRFLVTGTKNLPAWHPSAGGLSWVFLDEIVVK
jgi:hypothetical protein